jgi:hypothetical protein
VLAEIVWGLFDLNHLEATLLCPSKDRAGSKCSTGSRSRVDRFFMEGFAL